MPAAYLSVSTDVLPSIRFYDRVSTTVLNAYVGPKLEHYLEQLVQRLDRAGFAGLLLIMQSNGGVISPQAAREKAALTLLSGPAGGPGAGLFYAGAHGHDRCITTDMGGTSFEASVALGAPMVKNDGKIARHRIALPMLDIHTIGAGGGSIGWLDQGGLLRMGPQSAGADPGPACYGRGGTLPTTTDANVVLGYLDPEFFAGGQMRLDVGAARRAIQEHIARPMGLTIEQAAAGMYRVACNNMAQGVREVTIKRGFDPREFPLIPGGGAGPIHGCLICSELEIPLQIVPREASVLCAFGMLMCELRHDYVRTFVARLESLDWARLAALVETMSADGNRALAGERIAPARRRVELRLDCRYVKQYHEVSVPVPLDAIVQRDTAAIAQRLPRRAPAPVRLFAGSRALAGGNHQRAAAGDRRHRPSDLPQRDRRQHRRRGSAEGPAPGLHRRARQLRGGAGVRRPPACAAAIALPGRRSSSSRPRRSSSAPATTAPSTRSARSCSTPRAAKTCWPTRSAALETA